MRPIGQIFEEAWETYKPSVAQTVEAVKHDLCAIKTDWVEGSTYAKDGQLYITNWTFIGPKA